MRSKEKEGITDRSNGSKYAHDTAFYGLYEICIVSSTVASQSDVAAEDEGWTLKAGEGRHVVELRVRVGQLPQGCPATETPAPLDYDMPWSPETPTIFRQFSSWHFSQAFCKTTKQWLNKT